MPKKPETKRSEASAKKSARPKSAAAAGASKKSTMEKSAKPARTSEKAGAKKSSAASREEKPLKKTVGRTAKKVAGTVTTSAKKAVRKVSEKASNAGEKVKAKAGQKAAGAKAGAGGRSTKAQAAETKPARTRAKGVRSGGASEVHIRPEEEIAPVDATTTREYYFHEHRDAAVQPVDRELPNEYGDTRITLLVRDPEWIYAYWEVNDPTRQELRIPQSGHDRRLVVRMYQISGRDWPRENAHYFFDIDISPYAANWYIKVPETNKNWCGELGVFDDEGNYIAVCRSNVVSTPRDGASEETDSEWMAVEETFQKLYAASAGPQYDGVREFRGSEMILRHLQRQVRDMLRGAALSSAGISSPGMGLHGLPETEKDFWLQVHTELILYGATQSDATVTVQGRPVKLNPDGTFTVRFSLPDGEQKLEVKAVNRDRDMERTITPVVKKTTK